MILSDNGRADIEACCSGVTLVWEESHGRR